MIPYRRAPLAIALADRQATPCQQQQAGGQRYKFQGSYFYVQTGTVGGSPLDNISAATNANPCVLTVTGNTLVDGDVVYVKEVGGMVELNNTSYIVDVVTPGSTFILRDTDSTGYGTYTSGGNIDYATFSNFCELTGYDRTGGSSPEIDATSACSTAAEYEVGLPDSGTTKIDFNFAPKTSVQVALAAYNDSKAIMAVKISLPNSGGNRAQLGFVQQYSESVVVGGLWKGSVTIRNTGRFFDYT